jgi:peroxin-10
LILNIFKMTDHISEVAAETPSYNYPFAAAPDIIRSHQKDAYFEGILLNHLSNLLRRLYGARFLHTYTSEARTFSELLYLGLTRSLATGLSEKNIVTLFRLKMIL